MKFKSLILAFATTILLVTSCKDKEVPKGSITFEVPEAETFESDGTISSFHPLALNGVNGNGREFDIKLVSSIAMAENSVIKFVVSGNATAEASQANGLNDYEFVTSNENVTFLKGDKEATITIRLYEDTDFDIDANNNLYETITLTLESVVAGPATIGTEKTYTLKINEDDAVVLLDYSATGQNPLPQDPEHGNVDMDLLLLSGGTIKNGSTNPGASSEIMFIPAGFPGGQYGISYNYYEGTSNNLTFEAYFYNFGGTLNGASYNDLTKAPLIFKGAYTLVNVHAWSNASLPQVEQNITKSGYNYTNMSNISIPVSGSRIDLNNGSHPKPSLISADKVTAGRILSLIKTNR